MNTKTVGMQTTEGGDKEIKKIQTYFREAWNGSKPLAKLFSTDSSGYLYETGSNKVLRCQTHVFDLLKCFFDMDIESGGCGYNCGCISSDAFTENADANSDKSYRILYPEQ